MFKLTHKDLMDLGQLMGYEVSEGLCHGFTCMLMQAVIAGEESRFWDRLKLIEMYKPDFSRLLKDINEIKLKFQKSNCKLAPQELALLEIEAFYDGIELYLSPEKHQELFSTFTTSDDLADIYSLTKPNQSETENLKIIFQKVYACDKNELKDYLDDLEIALHRRSNLVTIITNINHSVFLRWGTGDPAKTWVYVDTNDFEEYIDNPDYYRELSTEELVSSLFLSLNKNHEHVVFQTKIVTDSPPLIPEQKFLKNFYGKYKISSEKTTLYDIHGVGMLTHFIRIRDHQNVSRFIGYSNIDINKAGVDGYTPLLHACFNGDHTMIKLLLDHSDMDPNKAELDGMTPLYLASSAGCHEMVKLLLSHKHTDPNKALPSGETPLYIACQNSHVDVVKLLLAHEHINVNQPRADGATPLTHACYNGDIAIVKLLLDSQGIRNDDPEKLEETPLLAACRSPLSHGKNELFQILLANQANIFSQNEYHETPLDMAFKENNETAIVELLIHVKNENLSIIDLMSNATQIKMNQWLKEKVVINYTLGFFANPLFAELKYFVEQQNQVNNAQQGICIIF